MKAFDTKCTLKTGYHNVYICASVYIGEKLHYIVRLCIQTFHLSRYSCKDITVIS